MLNIHVTVKDVVVKDVVVKDDTVREGRRPSKLQIGTVVDTAVK
jgi:hypothetical protein